MRVKFLVPAVLALLIAILASIIVASITPLISDLSYYAVYDPRTNCGVMEIRTRINLEDLDYIEIPVNVFNVDAWFNLVNYTSSEDLLVLGVKENRDKVLILVTGTGELILLFHVCNILEELGVGAYSLEVNTESFSSIALNVSVVLIFVGNYSIYTETVKLEYSENKLANFTLISFKGFGLARVALIPDVKLEEVSPKISPEYSQRELQWSALGVIAGFIITISVVSAYFLITRRREGLVIDKVDYLTDSAYRAVIRVLGDSGNKGLLQSEIVSKTGLSKSTVSRKLRRLEEEGLVTIKRSGKYNYVYLTEKGLKAYKKIVEEGVS